MIACQETQRPGVLAEGSNIPILVGHHLASALSNVSMKDHPLQQLRDLDRASPHFYVQLSNLLRGDAYQELLPRLQADDSCWLVEYLDSVGLQTILHRVTLTTSVGSRWHFRSHPPRLPGNAARTQQCIWDEESVTEIVFSFGVSFSAQG